jgi:hypothetical protein
MTSSPSPCCRARWRGWVSVLLLPVIGLALACENGAAPKERGQSTDVDAPIVSHPPAKPLLSPPQVTARITPSKPNWKDGQQIFTLTLTNNGTKTETVHAIVYGTNEEMHPPRRAISPPTAYDWFKLVGSRDGKLTARDLERNWKNNPFVSARGGKMPASWVATLEAGQSKDIEASHSLDDVSPHPATKGKTLAKQGFVEYSIWLFTSDGQLFDEQTVSAKSGAVVERPSTGKMPPETKKTPPDTKPALADTKKDTKSAPPETKPEDPEETAKQLFRQALADLEKNQPARAREKVLTILDKYPKTKAANAARQLLKDLDRR